MNKNFDNLEALSKLSFETNLNKSNNFSESKNTNIHNLRNYIFKNGIKIIE
jgi:hypothetical protein